MEATHHGESAEKRERREARERRDFVGFVCCSHGDGRVLKVKLPDERRAIRARCPVDGCADGEHKTGSAMPRPRRRGEVCDTELVKPTTPDDTTTPDDDSGKGSRKVSDAAILEAIPPGREVLAGEVAKELGYAVSSSGGSAQSLLNRLRRMNKREELKDRPPLFVLSTPKRGHPMKIRRAGEGTIP